MMRSLLRALFALVSLALALPAHAGRPLTIDDAEPVAAGAYELELGLHFSKAPGERHSDLPAGIAYGLTNRFEIGASWGVHLRDRLAGANGVDTVSGPADLSLGFKWMPVRTEAGFLLALAGSVKFATANENKGLGTGGKDYDLTLIATKEWNVLAIDANLGHTWVGSRFDPTLADIVHYGAAVRYSRFKPLTLVGEVFADNPKGSKPQWQTSAGVQYALRENFLIDAGIGRRLSSSGPDWVAKIGFTATF